MTPSTDRAPIAAGSRRTAAVVAVALMLIGVGFSGCSVVKAIKKVAHTVENNKSTIDAFTTKNMSSTPTTFEATYVTTGSSPATVVYAVEPPKELAFKDTPTGKGSSSTAADIVVNSSGEYYCAPPSPSGAVKSSVWTCQKLPKVDASQYNAIFDFYTPAHWVTFLRDFALAAGFAGDKVSTSSKTVNGFAMSCVDFVATGEPGTSTICTTSQGLLGYVKVATVSTSFEITSYSTSPSASVFQLPPGAKITTVTIPSTTTTT
jgi:hypothetical protein